MKSWILVATMAAALTMASILIGAAPVSFGDLIAGSDRRAMSIMLASRIPRSIALVLAGCSMAIAGLIMQLLSRNRFVEPGTTGTIEFATLGLLITALLAPGLPIMAKMLVSSAAALLGTIISLAILRRVPLRSPLLLPLVGLMLGSVVNASATFIAYRFELLQALIAWSTGDFSTVLSGRYELLWISSAAAGSAYLVADRLTVAGLGSDISTGLGLNYRATLTAGLVIVAVATAAVVATVGAIPFVGLVIPNIVSSIVGDNMRRAVPWTACLGAVFVLACDIVGRSVIYPYEIPIGSIIGIVGGAIFLFLLAREKARFA